MGKFDEERSIEEESITYELFVNVLFLANIKNSFTQFEGIIKK